MLPVLPYGRLTSNKISPKKGEVKQREKSNEITALMTAQFT